MAMATYTAVSRVLGGRDKQKSAHQTIRNWLKETSAEHDIEVEFTLAELDAVLKKTENSTCDEDGVNPLMLKDLTEWATGVFEATQQELERGPSADRLRKRI